MAEIKMRRLPSKPTRERREDALERLLLLACTILPDDLSELGANADVAGDLTGEAAFWLDLEPRGAKVHATSAELRLGWKAVQERRACYAEVLDAEGCLVPAKPAAQPEKAAAHAGPVAVKEKK